MMKQTWPVARTKKFEQAAFVYLYVAILYESTVYVMFDANILPVRLGPPIIWLIAGGLIALSVFLGLYFWKNVWIARTIWCRSVSSMSKRLSFDFCIYFSLRFDCFLMICLLIFIEF